MSFQSQTLTEHRDLVKYEHDLATCYEAEYLLNLKLQDEIYDKTRRLNLTGTGSSSDDDGRDDGYEVLCCGGSEQRQLMLQGSSPATGITLETVCDDTEPMDTSDTNLQRNIFSNTQHEHPRPEILESESQVSHTQSHHNHLFTPHVPGYLHGQYLHTLHENTHSEGPSRKKKRLHQPESQ